MLKRRGGIWVDYSDHLVFDARSRSATIQENRLRIVDENCELRRVRENRVHRKEARKESNFVDTSIFVGNARIAILCTDHGVICRIELKQDCVADLSQSHIRHEGEASLCFVSTIDIVLPCVHLTKATPIVCVIGPCDVLVAFVELLVAALFVLEEESVGEGAGVVESVGVGVDESVAETVES